MYGQLEARQQIRAEKIKRKDYKTRRTLEEMFKILRENPSPKEL